ncbi:MAG: alpha/beta fold hydrolase [Geitlerinemataceae cyanobacterium]
MESTAGVWKHQYVTANNIRLHCVTQGSGDLVVLLHGLPEFWYSWRHQIPVLARQFTVVVPDLRGFNDSEKPESGYDLDSLVADLRGLIASLGYEKAHVVGHDWGGSIAWRFAREFPQMLDRLAVLSLPCPQTPLAMLGGGLERLRRSGSLLAVQWLGRSEDRERMGLQDAIAQFFREQSVRQAAFSAEDAQLYQAALTKPGALAALFEHYRQCLSPQVLLGNLWDRSKSPGADIPTLVLLGDQDASVDRSLWQNLTRSLRAPLTLKTIARCGHWVQQEAPQTVNRELLDFLTGSHSSGRA